MSKTTKKQRMPKTPPPINADMSKPLPLSADARGLSIKALKATTKAERQKLICDAFQELHQGWITPYAEFTLGYEACDVAAWAIRHALYPVPGTKATAKESNAWAESFRQAIERAATLTLRERLAEVSKHRLKLG
jgi:hypothetical protein